jgi:hypothetical protein
VIASALTPASTAKPHGKRRLTFTESPPLSEVPR